MFLGYNTNGFAHHRLADALAVLAELGYDGAALTLDHNALDPFADDLPQQVERVRRLLQRFRLRCVVETGARFLLDPRRKHRPTLLSPEPEQRQLRLHFLRQAVEIAAGLGADVVSFWSGAADDEGPDEALWERLADGCLRLLDAAARHNVRLAFEPEPGMFVDTMPRFARLWERVAHPLFGLTLDVGHLHCLGELPIEEHIRRWRDVLWNVHIEDMRRGRHDHLFFGEGEMAFAPILAALAEAGYSGGVFVELSRHAHDAVETARRSLAFLRPLLPSAR
jgi:L-ribulose-5-phosphate 3-epimerase